MSNAGKDGVADDVCVAFVGDLGSNVVLRALRLRRVASFRSAFARRTQYERMMYDTRATKITATTMIMMRTVELTESGDDGAIETAAAALEPLLLLLLLLAAMGSGSNASSWPSATSSVNSTDDGVSLGATSSAAPVAVSVAADATASTAHVT